MTIIPIPEHWGAEEALRVAAFLEDVVRAVWDVHGRAMSQRLQDHHEELDAVLEARQHAPLTDEDDWPL